MSLTTRDGTIVHCTCGRTYTFAPPEGDPGCECGRGPSGFFEGGEVPRELGYTIQSDYSIGIDHGAGPDRTAMTVLRIGDDGHLSVVSAEEARLLHPAAFRDLAEDPDAPKVEINLGPFGGATPNRQQRRAAARRAR